MQINMPVLKQCVMATTYLSWNQCCNPLLFGVNRTWNHLFTPTCRTSHSIQGSHERTQVAY